MPEPQPSTDRAAERIHKFRTNFVVRKYDDEQGLVFGWGSISETSDGSMVFDHEGDGIPATELEKAAYAFNLSARVASDSHDPATLGVGQLVESMFFSKEKQDLLRISCPVGWWVGFQTDDAEMRKSIREAGGHAMFSIGGFGVRTEEAA